MYSLWGLINSLFKLSHLIVIVVSQGLINCNDNDFAHDFNI